MSTDNEVTNINMLDWGMIAAFAIDKLNQFITQVYIQRYNATDFLPPVSGVMEAGGGEWRYKIESFLMDRPRIFFKSTSLNDSGADMVMRVLGGNQINQKYINQQWYAQSVEYFSPVQGPLLRFKLKLPDTPIDVEADGTLYLDLKDSDDFILEFSDVEHDQEIGGDFFKKLFSKLDDSKRRYPFGKIDPEASDAWMRPRKIYMRTQRNLKAQEGEGEGAVLLFIQVGDEPVGNLPDRDSSFEYLLRQGETARVLFNRYSMAMRLTADDFKQLFGASAVEFTKDNRNRVTGLRLTASSIVQPERPVGYFERFGFLNHTASCTWRANAFATEGGQKIDFVVNEKGIGTSGLALNAKVAISQAGLGQKVFLELAGDNLPDFQARLDREVPKEMLLDYKVSFSYPEIGANAKVSLQKASAVDARASDERDEMERGAVGRQSTQVADFVPSEFIDSAVEWANSDSIIWSQSLRMALVSGYEVLFANKTKTEDKLDYILDLIKLNFGEAIMIENATLTMDGDVGGLISPQLTTFRLNDLEVVVQAGGSYPFTLSPAMSNIEWTLDAPNRNRRQGTISDKGVYTAPHANEIEGLFTHVRVTATDRDTKFSSSALVTVLKNPLIVNPLIDSTSGLPRKIKAGAVGDANQPLTWSIKKTGTEGSLDKTTGNTVTYMPSKNFGTDPNVTFVVDEVTVSNGKESATSYIVNRKSDPVNVIGYTVNGNNTVQCKATVNGKDLPATWKVLVGPGEIDPKSGLYTADPASINRFVLIHSLAEIEALDMKFSGYLVLPLPLAEQGRALPGTVEVSSGGEIMREIRPMN